MIKHQSFSSRHFVNIVGSAAVKSLEEMRREAERFIENHLEEETVISITETSDEYASTVTVWYRAN